MEELQCHLLAGITGRTEEKQIGTPKLNRSVLCVYIDVHHLRLQVLHRLNPDKTQEIKLSFSTLCGGDLRGQA